MSIDAWLVIVILVATFVALLATRLPPATVFLGALTLSVTFDLAPLVARRRESERPIVAVRVAQQGPHELARRIERALHER